MTLFLVRDRLVFNQNYCIISGLGGTCSHFPTYGPAPAVDDLDSTHGSLSTDASDCQRHEYFVEPCLPPYVHWV